MINGPVGLASGKASYSGLKLASFLVSSHGLFSVCAQNEMASVCVCVCVHERERKLFFSL
jgi:hypothetical protein